MKNINVNCTSEEKVNDFENNLKKEKKEKIIADLKLKYDFLQNKIDEKHEKYKNNAVLDSSESSKPEIFGIFLRGSQNYGLDISDDSYQSDIDAVAAVIPDLDTLIRGEKINKTYIMDDGGHLEVKDIRLMADMILKGNPSYLEMLFTDYWYVPASPHNDYRFTIESLSYNDYVIAVKLAKVNRARTFDAILGQMFQQSKKLFNDSESTHDDIVKYGYSRKAMSHILRLYDFVEKLISGESYKDAMYCSDEKVLLIKKGELLLPGGNIKTLSEEKVKKAKDMILGYKFSHDLSPDTDTIERFKRYVSRIIEIKITKDILKID